MASKTSTQGSSKTREPLDLEAGLVTTREDIEVLRRLRHWPVREHPLRNIKALQLPSWIDGLSHRKTSEGWEPFEL